MKSGLLKTNESVIGFISLRIANPARFQWYEVKKVEHYYLSVDAVTRPMPIKENPTQFGDQEK
jgi:hypothetical protein